MLCDIIAKRKYEKSVIRENRKLSCFGIYIKRSAKWIPGSKNGYHVLAVPESRYLGRCIISMCSKREVSNTMNRELPAIDHLYQQAITGCILIWTLANEKLRILFTFLGSFSSKIGKKDLFLDLGRCRY